MTTSVIKANAANRYLLVVAYSANSMPARGADKRTDVASPEVLERACWKFALNGFKVGMHHQDGTVGAATVVENFVWRGEPTVFKSPDGSQQVIGPGDWCVGLILSPAAWQEYQRGAIKGASPQGTAKRKPASPETLKRIARTANV